MADKDDVLTTGKILETAETHLSSVDTGPFSENAFSLLQEKISEYIQELIYESDRVSQRQGVDSISQLHVQRASEYLTSGARRKYMRHLGAIGGVLLGAALSNIITMVSNDSSTSTGILLAFGFAALGSSLVAFHMAGD